MSDRTCAALTWTSQFGSSASDDARAVAIDASGNVYVAGTTTGTFPGEASAGGQDAFVRKYDASGNVLWTDQFGTSAVDLAQGVAVDASGNVFVAGYTQGTLPGQVSAGSQDAYVRKYNSAGTLVWTSQFGSTVSDSADAIAIDPSGNVIVAGQTLGTLPGQASAGAADAWVRKLTTAGATTWTRQFGTFDYENALACATDASGNVFVAGQTLGALGGTNAGVYDAYVRRFDANGNNPWTRQLGSIESDSPKGIDTDASGNVFIAGEATDALPGQTAISAAGSADSFVAKYDSTGTLLWTRQFGTNTQDQMTSITVDASGNSIAAGSISGVLSGQPSAGGGYDLFMRKYDPSGNEIWTRRFGSASSEFALGVSIVGSGNVAVAGNTQGTLSGQTSAGGTDAFVIVAPP